MKRTQTGFTLIELVIVIVILGLLAATALPKFADLTNEARDAACRGVGGGFKSGVAIVHAKWLAVGAPTTEPVTVQVEGGTVSLTTAGWPDVSDYGTPADLYTALMSEEFGSLGAGWTTGGASPTASYNLAGAGGCTILYTDTTGTTSITPNP